MDLPMKHHLLIAALLFMVAAPLYVPGDPTRAMWAFLLGALVEGIAWRVAVEGGSVERSRGDEAGER